MAIKKCKDNHSWDAQSYGDKCPMCGETAIADDNPTVVINNDSTTTTAPNKQTEGGEPGGGGTIIRPISDDPNGGKMLVGILVSFTAVKTGEVYKVYEGATTIGRGLTCDICVPNDPSMSDKHLLIQYIPAIGKFKAVDQGSSLGSTINGKLHGMGDVFEIHTNDILVLGNTVFTFFEIPKIWANGGK